MDGCGVGVIINGGQRMIQQEWLDKLTNTPTKRLVRALAQATAFTVIGVSVAAGAYLALVLTIIVLGKGN